MKTVGLFYTKLFLLGFMAAVLPKTGWTQTIVLNEVLADNTDALDNSDSSPDYIELKNVSGAPIDLRNYRITDDINQPLKFQFTQSLILTQGQRLVVFADDVQIPPLPGIHLDFRLNRGGENLRLLNAFGVLIDAVGFGIQLTDLPIGRVPDGTGPWVLNEPTPGETNVAAAMGGTDFLSINEWMPVAADGGGLEDDWIELYNGTNLPVAVGGLFLTDRVPGDRLPDDDHVIAPLSFIEPFGFIQFIADNDGDDADHLGFRLSSTGGEFLSLLFANRVSLLDQIAFGPTTMTNISQGRLPDGSSNIVFFQPEGRDTPEKSNFLILTNVVFNEIISPTVTQPSSIGSKDWNVVTYAVPLFERQQIYCNSGIKLDHQHSPTCRENESRVGKLRKSKRNRILQFPRVRRVQWIEQGNLDR